MSMFSVRTERRSSSLSRMLSWRRISASRTVSFELCAPS